MRNAILATGLILAGVSTRLVTTPPGPVDGHSERGATRAGHSSHENLAKDHPLALICDFFDKTCFAPPAAGAPQKVSGSLEVHGPNSVSLSWKAAAADEETAGSVPAFENLTVMLATVPDPQRTHLALSFDRYVESIIAAAVDSRYIFDRYWLPWRTDAEREIEDPEKRKVAEAERKKRETLPGLLLFRGPSENDDAPKKALAVFLVGETPTSGLSRAQFRNAVTWMHNLAPAMPALKVLGPSFSGSIDSLRQALRDDLPPDWKAIRRSIVSGASSSQHPLERLRDAETPYAADGQPAVRTTIHSDLFALQSLMQSDLLRGQRLAVIAEDATVYSGQFRNIPENGQQPLIVYYPREISRLRNASQDDTELASRNTKSAQGAQQQLALDLRDTDEARDTLPEFSAVQTPITQETALLHVAESLKREKIRAALVIGTNVLDVLFLTRFLRRASPDVRLIAFGSDLLFVHALDAETYGGILAVSTYPLVLENQLWTQNVREEKQPHLRRFFPSNAAEGVYNAGLLLLRPRGGPATPLREYATPNFGRELPSQFPPLWLTAIGRTGYLPLDFLAHPKDLSDLAARDDQTPSVAPVGHPGHLWGTIFTSLGVLSACLFLVFVYAHRKERALDGLPRWCADFVPAPAGEYDWGRCLFLCVTLFMALLFYYTLALAPMQLATYPLSQLGWKLAFAGSALVLMLLGAAVLATALRLPPRWRLIALLPAVLMIWFLIVAGAGDSPRSLFRAMRSVEMFSGVSPDLPAALLLATLGVWAWTQMQRFIFRQERRVYLPKVPRLHQTSQDTLDHILSHGCMHADPSGIAIIAGSFLLTFSAAIVALHSLESRSYDFTIATVGAFAAATLMGTAYCHHRIWRKLRCLLQNLELHPLREAFSRLPVSGSWSSWWQPSARKRNYAIPTQSVECLRRLAVVAPQYHPRLLEHRDKLCGQWSQLQPTVLSGLREPAASANLFQKIAADVATDLGEVLAGGAWSTGSSGSWDKVEAQHGRGTITETHASSQPPRSRQFAADIDSPEQPDLLAAEFVALRYVAHIRYVILQLRNLLSFLSIGFILFAIAFNCYSFEGGNLFRWWITAMFALLSIAVVSVFAELERDAVLSRLTDTTAGKLEKGFYIKLVSAGALPLLTVIGSHFPALGRLLFSWVQPALSAVK